MLNRLFQKKTAASVPAAEPGERVYAVGDIHGRLDLLERALAMIDADDATRPATQTRLVLLGDLIDRGPNSRGVIDRTIALTIERPDVTVLMGNHEEILLEARGGDRQALGLFNRVGGRDTLLSYGAPAELYDAAGLDELLALIDRYVPDDHIAFMESLGERAVSGDYLFVHAGVRPKVALDAQKASDLRWIREPFLSSTADHGAVVVHGHTITDAVEDRGNRIGIDTGAYASGRLTVLGVEGTERWFLTT